MPTAEVDEVRWLPPERAASLLSYKRDLNVIDALSAPPLLVVRHASAGDSETWVGDDRLRPLDKKGRRQAEELVARLAPYELERILSSPHVRCVQTVEPLAEARALEVETSDDLAEGAGPDRLRRELERLAGTAAVVCGHGPELVPIFGRTKKGATWVVDPTDLRPLELLPP
jgi:phosphohistidine phosphatase SixA